MVAALNASRNVYGWRRAFARSLHERSPTSEPAPMTVTVAASRLTARGGRDRRGADRHGGHDAGRRSTARHRRRRWSTTRSDAPSERSHRIGQSRGERRGGPTREVDVAGVTTTDATVTSVTVTLAVPTCPSLVAEMVTGPPAATPVTIPQLAHGRDGGIARRPSHRTSGSTLPLESFVVAVSCCVAPTMSDALDGDTVTVATGAGGGGPRPAGGRPPR